MQHLIYEVKIIAFEAAASCRSPRSQDRIASLSPRGALPCGPDRGESGQTQREDWSANDPQFVYVSYEVGECHSGAGIAMAAVGDVNRGKRATRAEASADQGRMRLAFTTTEALVHLWAVPEGETLGA